LFWSASLTQNNVHLGPEHLLPLVDEKLLFAAAADTEVSMKLDQNGWTDMRRAMHAPSCLDKGVCGLVVCLHQTQGMSSHFFFCFSSVTSLGEGCDVVSEIS
jgi:hypothetical protein